MPVPSGSGQTRPEGKGGGYRRPESNLNQSPPPPPKQLSRRSQDGRRPPAARPEAAAVSRPAVASRGIGAMRRRCSTSVSGAAARGGPECAWRGRVWSLKRRLIDGVGGASLSPLMFPLLELPSTEDRRLPWTEWSRPALDASSGSEARRAREATSAGVWTGRVACSGDGDRV